VLDVVDKQKLMKLAIGMLEQELTALSAAAKAAHEAATHEESKAEDQHDTRGIEASYLAGAHASRKEELERQILTYRFFPIKDFEPGDVIVPGALVELELQGRRSHYFLITSGGGITVLMDGRPVRFITPRAPLGEALTGRRLGETVSVESQSLQREYEIVGIQ